MLRQNERLKTNKETDMSEKNLAECVDDCCPNCDDHCDKCCVSLHGAGHFNAADADDDGVSNLLEFFAGTDSLSSQESYSPELKMFEQGPFSHVQYQYRERLGPVGLTPKFYCSRTLAADSWYPIVRPRFTEDIVGDGFRLRTLDLTNEVVEGQPLFIKMHLDVID
jgi:hypothetical protein